MTKAERILTLYSTGKYTTAQIADVVGCLPAYVRVVARQRMGSGLSEIDRRYLASPLGRSMRRSLHKRYYQNVQNDPERREARNAYQRKYARERYWADPEFRERCLASGARSYARRKAEARAS